MAYFSLRLSGRIETESGAGFQNASSQILVIEYKVNRPTTNATATRR